MRKIMKIMTDDLIRERLSGSPHPLDDIILAKNSRFSILARRTALFFGWQLLLTLYALFRIQNKNLCVFPHIFTDVIDK